MEIKLKNISYTYNANTKLAKEVLKNINLNCKDSNVYTILGSNDSGKTTLLEIINGLLDYKGNIEFIGRKKIKTGMIFQNPEDQFLKRTVKKELELTVSLLEPKKRKEKLEHILTRVGLDKTYLPKTIWKLSQSEMKKVALASMLLYNPNVILLDEPTIGLDEVSTDNLLKVIRYLKSKNKIIIIASKDIEFIHRITNYIYVINEGQIVLEGDKYEVFTNKKLSKYNIKVPQIIKFEMLAKEKNIKLDYRDDIRDLMKDVFNNVNK